MKKELQDQIKEFLTQKGIQYNPEQLERELNKEYKEEKERKLNKKGSFK